MAVETKTSGETTKTDGSGKSDMVLPDGAALIAAELGETLGGAVEEEEGAEAGSEEAGGEADPLEEGAGDGAGADADETQDGEEATEDAEENEDEEGAIKGLTPTIQAKIDKRINKEVARRKEAEGALEAVRAELEEAKAAGPRETLPLEVDPVRRHPSVAAALQEETQAERMRSAADELLERLEGDDDAVAAALQDLARVNVKVRDAEHAKRVLKGLREDAVRKADRAITKREMVEGEVRAALEGERQRFDVAANTAYPWLKDKATEEYQTFDNVLKQNPWLKTWPAGRLAVADMVAGARVRMAAAAAQAKATPARPGTPKPAVKIAPKPAGAPKAAPNGKGNPKEALRSQALKDPNNEEARVGYLSSLLN